MTYLQHLLIVVHAVPMGETALICEIQSKTNWPLHSCMTVIRTMEAMQMIHLTNRGYRLLPAGVMQVAKLINSL